MIPPWSLQRLLQCWSCTVIRTAPSGTFFEPAEGVLLVLIDGAIAATLVTTDPAYFDAARRAALSLLGAS